MYKDDLQQPVLLVVDDEEKIVTIVSNHLRQEGFHVITASHGAAALRELEQRKDIDLVLLDWMMPGMSGLEVCRKLRSFSDVPVIFLTAKTDEFDKLLGLELGADDYITKPFSIREMSTRIRVVLRRTRQVSGGKEITQTASNCITRGPLSIDLDHHSVTVHGQAVELTPTEYKLLVTLAESPGRVFTRLQILEMALGEEYAGYERSIDTHIRNLRKKIEQDASNPVFVQTVFGFGYKFGTSV